MSVLVKAVLALLAVVLLIVTLPVVISLGGLAANANACSLPPSGDRLATGLDIKIPLTPRGPQHFITLDAKQQLVAVAITATGMSRQLPPRAVVLATAAALAESELVNDPDPTRDGASGLFGMQPPLWGTRAQVNDPIYATNRFFDALLHVPGWQTRPLTQVISQALRTPDELADQYAQWEQMSGRTVRDALTRFNPVSRPELPADCGTGTSDDGADLGAVPPQYRAWITKSAAQCRDVTPALLAALLFQESRFRPNLTNPRSGAQGIAQFMPQTWPQWAVDADGDGTKSPYDAPDGIMAGGKFLCSLIDQAKRSKLTSASPVELALAGYNAGWGRVLKFRGIPPYIETRNYVRQIMARARKWAAASSASSGPVDLPPGFSFEPGTHIKVQIAVAWALKQRGTPYVYGGACLDPAKKPTNPSRQNCDCSSLMQQAYKKAGVTLTRTTFTQVNEGRAVSYNQIRAGDLLFTAGSGGTAASPGHVGMAIGSGLLVQAPSTGDVVKISRLSSWKSRIVAIRRII